LNASPNSSRTEALSSPHSPQKLTFKALKAIAAGLVHRLLINPHVAIASDGIASGTNSKLMISSNAAAGPVPPTAIVEVVPAPLEGAILSSNITFTRASCTFNGYEWICTAPPAIAGSPAEIGITFALKGAVASGEVVSLELPGFTGASVGSIPVTSKSFPLLQSVFFCFQRSILGCNCIFVHCVFPYRSPRRRQNFCSVRRGDCSISITPPRVHIKHPLQLLVIHRKWSLQDRFVVVFDEHSHIDGVICCASPRASHCCHPNCRKHCRACQRGEGAGCKQGAPEHCTVG
jgi:hypothetical protein